MEKFEFKAESARLMDLMIHSIYTHKEIFLRELISNASDAIDKLAYRALTDDSVNKSREDFAIILTADPESRTLTVSDNGIGMTRAELEENLGTICKSGSLSFKENMEKAEDIDIIGQFGVGFYSAFMAAEQITVITRAFGEEQAWKWTSNGVDGYTVEPAQRDEAGTDVLLQLKADTEEEQFSEYLEEYRIRTLVRKYSDYIRYPIRMEVTKSKPVEGEDGKTEYESYTEWETLNSMVPLWQRRKQDVTQEEYETFYREKFFDYQKPLRSIHISAEGAVSFKALLYIPAKAPYDFYTKDYKPGLQLYSSGVMIMENCADLLPEHFRFVRGVVDSQDLSLNISRELLQHDRQLTVIARNLEKKIKAELLNLLEQDRQQYETFFASFGRQLKYGTVADYGAHKDACKDLLLFYSAKQGKLITLKEYADAMPEGQERIYYAPGENRSHLLRLPQVEALLAKGFDVLLFGEDVDEFIPQTLMTYGDKNFCNALSEDLGLQTEEEKKSAEADAESRKGLLSFVQQTLGERVKQVRFGTNLGSHPVSLVPEEGMSFEMEKYMKRMDPEFSVKVGRILELNGSHEAVQALEQAMTAQPEKAADYARLLYHTACLTAGLTPEDPMEYARLVCSLMK